MRTPGSADELIFYSLRLPRVVLAALVGCALAASGAMLQSLLRNPLADPFVLGVSGGAALGEQYATSTGQNQIAICWLRQQLHPTTTERIAFSGAHDATVAAVAGGKVDAGALNISVWEKLLAQGKVDTTQVRVFYTTPGYFDYNWTVRSDMDPVLRKKLSDAFLALDAKNPQDKEILDLQRATRFIPTRAENYGNIEKAARSAGLLK